MESPVFLLSYQGRGKNKEKRKAILKRYGAQQENKSHVGRALYGQEDLFDIRRFLFSHSGTAMESAEASFIR